MSVNRCWVSQQFSYLDKQSIPWQTKLESMCRSHWLVGHSHLLVGLCPNSLSSKLTQYFNEFWWHLMPMTSINCTCSLQLFLCALVPSMLCYMPLNMCVWQEYVTVSIDSTNCKTSALHNRHFVFLMLGNVEWSELFRIFALCVLEKEFTTPNYVHYHYADRMSLMFRFSFCWYHIIVVSYSPSANKVWNGYSGVSICCVDLLVGLCHKKLVEQNTSIVFVVDCNESQYTWSVKLDVHDVLFCTAIFTVFGVTCLWTCWYVWSKGVFYHLLL